MIPIYVPSKGRANKIEKYLPWLKDYVGDIYIVVAEFEEHLYREVVGDKILVMSNDLIGNMSKIRNFILNHAEEKYGIESWICMCDDDVNKIRMLNKETHLKADLVNDDNWKIYNTGIGMQELLQRLLTEYPDGVMIGSNGVDNEFYKTGYSRSQGFICADCFLIKIGNNRYLETLRTKEDYYMVCTLIKEGKKIYQLGNLCVHAKHYNKGGMQSCSQPREEIDKESQGILLKMFPDMLMPKTRKDAPYELRFKRIK